MISNRTFQLLQNVSENVLKPTTRSEQRCHQLLAMPTSNLSIFS